MNLNQVTLPSLNVEAAIPFYEQLGLKLIVHTHPRYARFECPEGNATLSLHHVDAISDGEGAAIYFECTDLDERCKMLAEQGVEFLELPNDKSWRWREARLKDPDGNVLLLYFAGEDRKNPPWRKAV